MLIDKLPIPACQGIRRLKRGEGFAAYYNIGAGYIVTYTSKDEKLGSKKMKNCQILIISFKKLLMSQKIGMMLYL